MSNYLVSDTDLTSVANAIRTKGGTSAQLAFPADFVTAIGAINSGGYATGTITFTSRTTTFTIDTGLTDVHGVWVMPQSASPYKSNGRSIYIAAMNLTDIGRITAVVAYSNNAGSGKDTYVIFAAGESYKFASKSGSVVTVNPNEYIAYGLFEAITWSWFAW